MGIIRSIKLKNFKAIGEQEATIAFAPVTLLFGPNSAGKSSIIQALHYAHEVLNRNNPDADRTLLGGRAIELGGFRNMVHQRDISRSIFLTFDLDLGRTDLPTYRVDYQTSHADWADWASGVLSASVCIRIDWSDLLERPYVRHVEVKLDEGFSINMSCDMSGKDSALWITADDPQDVYPSAIEVDHGIGAVLTAMLSRVVIDTQLADDGSAGLYRTAVGDLQDALPRRGRPLHFPRTLWRDSDDVPENREFTEQLSRLAVGPIDLLRDELARLVYIGPLRDVPERHIQPARSPDPARWSTGLAAWDLLAADPSALVGRTNSWLSDRQRFNSGYHLENERYREVRLDSPLGVTLASGDLLDAEQARTWYMQLPEQRRVRLVDDGKNIALAPQDLGIGLSQTIPILVAALHARDTLVLIEQPELHIHPAMQVEMGDLFIETAREGELHFLIESHSEHLLLRILRRIRETTAGEVPPGEPECRKEDVAVYFIEPDMERKETRVTRLHITDDGDFSDPWPRGFFEERDSELF